MSYFIRFNQSTLVNVFLSRNIFEASLTQKSLLEKKNDDMFSPTPPGEI